MLRFSQTSSAKLVLYSLPGEVICHPSLGIC